jgi:hypothetical protein
VRLTAGDIREAHERIGPLDEIVWQRRTLYAVAVDLCVEEAERTDVDDEVLDNPAVRGHLGAVLGGRSRYSPSRLRPLSELVAPGFVTDVDGCRVRLASAPSAPSALEDALRRIAGELQRHGDEKSTLHLLTVDDGGAIDEAYGHILDGVRLATRIAPELVLDLLPHVALFAVTDDDPSARLGSASAREFPGLILIPVPRSALEVAEALVHEGAHQKFFDLGTTRAMLGATAPWAPRFAPSWAPPGAHEWPLEQSVAAWHAYHCLAVFARCLGDSGEPVSLHADSLLPKAADRAAEIGRWLRDRGSFLGADAHTLIRALEGVPPHDRCPDDETASQVVAAIGDEDLLLRRAGGRTLVARRGRPPDLYWIDSGLPLSGSGKR